MEFEDWKEFYGWGFCTQAQLQEAVQLGILTEEQYNEIVGVSTASTDSSTANSTVASSTTSDSTSKSATDSGQATSNTSTITTQ